VYAHGDERYALCAMRYALKMTCLSVNINKFATLRNARGGNKPNLIQVAKDCERFGAQGITVHPRQDERHIRYQDVSDLASIITTEFNIEGYPSQKWLNIVKKVVPAQATLVPDKPGQLTSDHGWDTNNEEKFLKDIISELKDSGIRTSIFVDPVEKYIEGAAKVDTDRIELYTEEYAKQSRVLGKEKALAPYLRGAKLAGELGLGINAGHDLDLYNLKYFKDNIPNLLEVSIGHALICDSIYLGLENAIQLYLRELNS